MLKKNPCYPFIFSIFPILSLAAYNIGEISLDVVFRPLVLSLLFCVIIMGLTWLIFRDWSRTALSVLIVLLLFFSYGHIYNALEDSTFSNISIFRHRTLVPVLGLVLVIAVFWGVRKSSRPPGLLSG